MSNSTQQILLKIWAYSGQRKITGLHMRPVLMSSEGHRDKQPLVYAVEGAGCWMGEMWGLGMGDSQALWGRWPPQLQHSWIPSPLLPFLHSTLGSHSLSYCFVWRPVSLFMFFFFQCVRLETPVVVKLPWLSLKPRPNEIWMCREWIRVMEWAKYCLCGVSAILSWGDRNSGLRKVKSLSKFSAFISRPEKFASMQCWWLLATEYFGVWGKTGVTGNNRNLYLWWGFDLKKVILTTSVILQQIYYASDI